MKSVSSVSLANDIFKNINTYGIEYTRKHFLSKKYNIDGELRYAEDEYYIAILDTICFDKKFIIDLLNEIISKGNISEVLKRLETVTYYIEQNRYDLKTCLDIYSKLIEKSIMFNKKDEILPILLKSSKKLMSKFCIRNIMFIMLSNNNFDKEYMANLAINYEDIYFALLIVDSSYGDIDISLFNRLISFFAEYQLNSNMLDCYNKHNDLGYFSTIFHNIVNSKKLSEDEKYAFINEAISIALNYNYIPLSYYLLKESAEYISESDKGELYCIIKDSDEFKLYSEDIIKLKLKRS